MLSSRERIYKEYSPFKGEGLVKIPPSPCGRELEGGGFLHNIRRRVMI